MISMNDNMILFCLILATVNGGNIRETENTIVAIATKFYNSNFSAILKISDGDKSLYELCKKRWLQKNSLQWRNTGNG